MCRSCLMFYLQCLSVLYTYDQFQSNLTAWQDDRMKFARFTYTNNVHEAVHAVAYLEEKVLPLPFGWWAEGRPYQPGNTGNKEQRAQDNGCNLHPLNYSQGDGLPLQRRQTWRDLSTLKHLFSVLINNNYNVVYYLCVFLTQLYIIVLYLQWVFGADCQDLVLEVAQLTAPGASLTDPADKAGLVCAAHRTVTATRAQQLPLQDTWYIGMRRTKCFFFHTLVLFLQRM